MELDHEKKGGPYTKDEQRKRLDEVYRLHFEYGYSARKIADFLKVNRGTINRDIMYWYANIANKWRHYDPERYVRNQVERLEVQRTRLRKQLDNTESFQEKITIERLILDIDTKITNFKIKLIQSVRAVSQEVADRVNQQYAKEKSSKRIISADTLLQVSDKALERIFRIFNEDRKF
ncbi:MAG: hypothetical protein HY476_04850 [Nitrosarchaeum sp.]|nr:hypothetical protein [Nitrosarchaeum sp.]